jgi:hypothetical protein
MLTHNGAAYRRVDNEGIEFSDESPNRDGLVTIKIMQMGKENLSAHVDLDWKIDQLKTSVFSEDLDKGKNVRVIFSGKILNDHEVLRNCGIKEGSVLQVAITDAVPQVQIPIAAAQRHDLEENPEIPPEFLYEQQEAMMMNEGTNAELLFGFSLGFMLGFIVLVLLWQPRTSRKQRIGILLGVGLHIVLSYNEERARQERIMQERAHEGNLTASPTQPANENKGA